MVGTSDAKDSGVKPPAKIAYTKGGYRDTIIGAVVVFVAAILLVLVYGKEDGPEQRAKTTDGYVLTARFNRMDGIGPGSAVRVAGVPVGKVIAQELDDHFRAQVTLRVANGVELTLDTVAAIQTDGLLGAKYIELRPGGDDRMLKPGDDIPYTQDAMVIEELLDMIIQQGKARRAAGSAANHGGQPVSSGTN